jgi:hypothetical protein
VQLSNIVVVVCEKTIVISLTCCHHKMPPFAVLLKQQCCLRSLYDFSPAIALDQLHEDVLTWPQCGPTRNLNKR